MTKQKNLKIEISFIVCVLILSGIFYYSGCNSSTTGPNNNNTTDTNIVKFDSLQISPYQGSPKNFSGCNLFQGKVTTDSDATRDINMRDSAGQGGVDYLRSGDQNTFNINSQGYETLFRAMNYGSITRAQFDTISVIPVGHDPIVEADFPVNSTIGMGCYNINIGQHNVFAFYLKGKFDHGVSDHQVFGLVYLEYGTGGGILPLSETVSVRINKSGSNKFK